MIARLRPILRDALPPLRQAALLYGLCALCILIEIVLQAGDRHWLASPRLRQTVYEYAGFWPGLMGPWQPNYPLQPWVMFLSHAVLHGGLLHLIFNMATLFSLGLPVQDRVGQRGLGLLLLASVLSGGLGYGLLTNSPSPMVGASGGLFGLAGGLLAWNYIDRFASARKLWPVLRATLLLVAMNVALWWLMQGHLAWQTHLGGFIGGWLAALLIDPSSRNEREEKQLAGTDPGTSSNDTNPLNG
ncbi:membrane associated rhomboid family serine protease [Cereibacter ovatus]|uniref:Membrane associated rhomboid family serine protease n=1 Tax=Cereibacter ovatus TaxID=439529 RepID=A0A285D3K6_9RHOB|nr:rhomboid family intramembrane serine protease [Cereibacter ovatus]SNX74275.1 membrane associated rhomboid family serine protease [Cereibacter ovatus]